MRIQLRHRRGGKIGKGLSIGALVAGGVLISPAGQAATTYQFAPAFVSGPSVDAKEIGVGPTDYPFVVTTDNRLSWLNKSYTCARGVCAESRSWETTIGSVSHVSVDLFGYAWTISPYSALFYGTTEYDPNFTNQRSPVSLCVKSFAAGFFDYGPNQDYTFPSTVTVRNPPFPGRTSFFVGCGDGDTKLYADNLTRLSASQMTHTGIEQIDIGESAVTFFTVEGTTNQVPWITHNTGALNKLYAWYDGAAHGAPFPSRRVAGRTVNFSVDSATDHWIAADNCIWQWLGDAYANGSWSQVACAVDSQLLIKQIAYAPQIPTSRGAVGPSQLWVLGQDGKVYVLQAVPS